MYDETLCRVFTLATHPRISRVSIMTYNDVERQWNALNTTSSNEDGKRIELLCTREWSVKS